MESSPFGERAERRESDANQQHLPSLPICPFWLVFSGTSSLLKAAGEEGIVLLSFLIALILAGIEGKLCMERESKRV